MSAITEVRTRLTSTQVVAWEVAVEQLLRRADHKHAGLTGDVGHPKLRSHIDGILPLMRVSDNWIQFKRLLKKAFPIVETTELGLEIELKERD
jgi:hypothetical protein